MRFVVERPLYWPEMDQWLDELSEDWASQPSSQQGSIIVNGSSPRSEISQTKIPRPTPSSTLAKPSTLRKEFSRRSSQLSDNPPRDALRERSSSSLNAFPQAISKQGPADQHRKESKSWKNTRGSRKSSLAVGIEAGTVQCKLSPNKDQDIDDAPEWRKRILQGKTGAGDQTDLFGPSGLENVFRPPTLGLRSDRKRSTKLIRSQDRVVSSDTVSHRRSSDPSLGSRRNSDERGSLQRQPSRENGQQIEDLTAKHTFLNDEALPGGLISQGSNGHPLTNAKMNSQDGGDPVQNHVGLEKSRISSTQSRYENISPFYISKHHTLDGRVDYAAIDMSLHTLRTNIQSLHKQPQQATPCASSDNEGEHSTSVKRKASLRQSALDEFTSQSLPDDLSVGTDAFIANGGFVSVHRGGYSVEGSFQNRSLSPSSTLNLDGPSMQKHRSRNVSSHKIKSNRAPPRTPERGGALNDSSKERPRSSGSPLKLFDKHDTFTMTRLARRMSKFEETIGQDDNDADNEAADLMPSSPSRGPKKRQDVHVPKANTSTAGSRISSFGRGELDGRDFAASNDLSFQLHKRMPDVGNQPQVVHEADFHMEQEEFAEEIFDNRRETPEEVRYSAHGKRISLSPTRYTATKRRKTVTQAEKEGKVPELQRVQQTDTPRESSEPSYQSRKRKDARYDDTKPAVDLEQIALRQFRHPRNKPLDRTMSREHLEAQQAKDEDNNSNHIRSQHTQHKDGCVIDPPTQIVAGALASIALNTAEDLENGSRKVSVTTSDFFREAQQIMALIRADMRPHSSHTPTETSQIMSESLLEQSFRMDSTRDSFSRPPSRQGRDSDRDSEVPIPDARVASHLRKFEDKDDLGFALSSSIRSLKIPNQIETSPGYADEARTRATLVSTDGSPQRKTQIEVEASVKRSSTKNQQSPEHKTGKSGQSQHNTQGSSGPETETEVRTGSSHSSVTINKIAPESVAHLLSDQMADMVFNHEKKIWVKSKHSRQLRDDAPSASHHTSNTSQEEDVLDNIPDLTVDEMEELERARQSLQSSHLLGEDREDISIQDHAAMANLADDASVPEDSSAKGTRPRTADGKTIPVPEDSSAPSKFSNFAWSGPLPGTRATSYGDEVWPDKVSHEVQPERRSDSDIAAEAPDEDVEREFSILEGRASPPQESKKSRKHQPRVITVSFSSPIVQSPSLGGSAIREYSHHTDPDESPSRSFSVSQNRPLGQTVTRSSWKRRSQRLSMGHTTAVARPMSRLDEADELSIIHRSQRHMNPISPINLHTSASISKNLIFTPSNAARGSTCLELTPLPDFTVHQIDQPVDAHTKTVPWGVHAASSRTVSNALSLTAQDLVKHLTDVEPYEPYWEELKQINLRGCGLSSLHMLDDFCGCVQELDVSNNQIGELGGIPTTVRMLNIGHNSLNDLAAWQSLFHLQYLDVSHNQLTSLSGLGSLIHLRALKADNNQIKSLDGIRDLSSLLCLSVSSNSLRLVDFGRFNL